MLNWPWSDPLKILKKRIEKEKEEPAVLVKFEDISDMLDSLKGRKPSIIERIKWDLQDLTWKIYRFFKPAHKQIRNAIPKQFVDISSLIVIVNFEFIKSFHDNEMHIVDWEYDEHYKEFKNWINSAYDYITIERPELEKELSNSYPPPKMKGTYEEKYKDVIRLEKLIETKDTEILFELIKRRKMFWS